MNGHDTTAASPLSLPPARTESRRRAGAPARRRGCSSRCSAGSPHGELLLTVPTASRTLRPRRTGDGGRADLTLHDWRVARDVLTGGDVAFAEAYMDGLLGHARPDRAAHRARRATRRRSSARSTASAWQRALFRLKHWLNANSTAAGEAQHRRALRPRQRLLPAVARPDDDLLVGAVRRRRAALARRCAASQVPADARRARAAAGRAHPGDRLRLGRLRRSRRARRLPRDRDCRCPTRRPRTRASASPGSASPTASSSASRTTATRAARSTGSPRSRCSRRSASAGGRRTSARVRERAAAGRARVHPDHHHRRRALRALPHAIRLHPAVHLPGRHAGLAVALRCRGECGRARARRTRSRFGRDYAETLRRWLAAFDGESRRRARAGFRRALHPLLALLPRVLRRRLRQRVHRCRAIHAAAIEGRLVRRETPHPPLPASPPTPPRRPHDAARRALRLARDAVRRGRGVCDDDRRRRQRRRAAAAGIGALGRPRAARTGRRRDAVLRPVDLRRLVLEQRCRLVARPARSRSTCTTTAVSRARASPSAASDEIEKLGRGTPSSARAGARR